MFKYKQQEGSYSTIALFLRLLFCTFACLTVVLATGESPAKKLSSSTKSTKSTKVKKPNAAFYKGLEEYNKQRFGPAAEQFELSDRTGYCCDLTHYYLALCYHNLNQTQRAIDHYAWVYSYSKNPTLKYQAQVGYEQVARYAGNRTYAGNGAVFAGFSGGRPGGGGGGG